MKKIRSILLGILLITALVLGVYLYGKNEAPVENAGTAQNAARSPEFLTYKGTKYPIKKHIQTVLLIGTDSTSPYEEKTEGVRDFYNFNQADFLMLLVLDTDAKTAEIIQLNRDTMMEVPWLDVLGEYGGTEFKQLCLAFNSGDGGVKSCQNTVDAVSSLLFHAPIQSYIQIPMTAVPVLNDLVGGVPVTIPEDLTAVDPAFVGGSMLTLTGSQAEKFVRARMELPDDTNAARMSRQRLYLDSFQRRARETLNSNSEFMMMLVEKLGEFMQSNLTAQQLSDLFTQLDNATISPIRYADGDLLVREHYEFYVNEDALWEIVKCAYCS